MQKLRILAICVLASTLCAFQPQPLDQMPGYGGHPEAPEVLWNVLASAKATADSKSGVWRVTFPDAVKGYAGATITLSGFVLPLEVGTTTSHFALTRRSPGCPFCPPSEPTEVVEVMSTRAIAPTPDLIMVEGKLRLVAESSQGLFYRLEGAVVK
jgi:hypothetical protein